MKVEVKDLMNDNEMLSHIFLGCIPKDKLREIKNNFIGSIDWRKESVKLDVEMQIAGVDVNPKEFFDEWQKQMQKIIERRAKNLIKEKLSGKLLEMSCKLNAMSDIVENWEGEINWESKNPFLNETN